jgi:phosphoadenosine phosphosulfate reductase
MIEMQAVDVEGRASELAALPLADALRRVAERFPGRVAFSTSLGQEDQVITDAIFRECIDVRVFTLDTGRLFAETYALIDATRQKYNARIEVVAPDATRLAALTTAKGFHSFYDSVENRKECCEIRKVEPLRRALSGAAVWVTGLRAEQSANRQSMKIIEWDAGYGLFKFNPLIAWSYPQVLEHIKAHKVPDSPLHRAGFISIGCAPCTRAIEPGEDPRAGRWWWETSKKECGLHRS